MTTPRLSMLAGLLSGAVLLSACTPGQTAALGQGLEAARRAKDAEAAALKAALCAMSVGAYHRVNNDLEQRAIDALCGGAWERPLTMDDVRLLRDLRELEGRPGGS